MAFLTAAAPLAAGGLNVYGMHLQNKANERIADKQMDFQERMSSTAYQRAMLDMEKAGLNPILAYGQGGASSPGGASIAQQNEVSSAVASAIDARRMIADLDKTEADTELTWNLARVARNEAQIKRNSAYQQELAIPGLKIEREIDNTSYGRMLRFLGRMNPFAGTIDSIRRVLN